jgi:hypothetical protein
MFPQLRTIHADELRKRVLNGCGISEMGTVAPLLAHRAGIDNNVVNPAGGKEMTGTTARHPG